MNTSIVYNKDCMIDLFTFKDNQFDIAVVDPPYGIDVANMNMGAGKSKRNSKISNRRWTSKNWDTNVPTDEYFNQLFRVSKNQIIWGGNYFNLPPCKNYIIWDKCMPDGLSFADCEMAWTSFSGAPKIFKYSAFLDKKDKFHPTQKPVKLYDWIFNKYTHKGQSVLDTHVGSGSIRISADEYGLDFTGYETELEYFSKQERRYADFKSQLKLFSI